MDDPRLRYSPKDKPISLDVITRDSSYIPRFIHVHASHELCLVSSASCFDIYTGGNRHRVEGPVLLFHRAHCYHELLHIFSDGIYESTVVHFRPETIPTAVLPDADCAILPLSQEDLAAFQRYFSLIPDEPTERQALAVQLGLSRALALVNAPGAVLLRAVDSYVFHLLRHISEHPDEKLTIDILSERYHVSATKLKQDFSRLTGTSVGRFLTNQRLNHACNLLQTDADLSDIALQCGFSSQSHFIAVFRSHYGITPGAYRKEGTHYV